MSEARGKYEHFSDGPLADGLPSIVAAAHELKSPLGLIRQLSLTLEESDLRKTDQNHILRQISLTSERALRLTSDLTRSIRLSDAMFELEPINPKQLCEDIVHELKPLFIAHNRDLKLVSRKHLLLVANRDLLRRIIINFSDNALNYTEGDTSIEIHINQCNHGKTVRLGVRDYGPALSNDINKSLNSKISNNVYSSINARPQSSGLGLYIASKFANVMNGEIGVMRHRNGSTFYVDLQSSQQLSLL